jgi:integrin beta 3
MMMMGGGEETPDAGAGAGADDSGADDSGADDSGADDSGAGADDSCDETLSGEKDAGYRGCQAQTVTGKTCQKWNIQTPHKHKKVLGEKGVGDHNYCRNPDGEDTIWCYTTDPDKRWEYCDPVNGRVCDETMSGEKDAGYRGCQTKTVTGKTCQRWTSQTPHTHKKVLGEKGVGGHNYCRNPDGEDTIWCYTTDPDKRWDYCEPL